MKVTDIISTLETNPVTLFRGIWFEKLRVHAFMGKGIYKRGEMSGWQSHRVLERVVLAHHNCTDACRVERKCQTHPKECHLQCQTTRVDIVHGNHNEYLIEPDYKNLSS
jgi:hypothetical protein